MKEPPDKSAYKTIKLAFKQISQPNVDYSPIFNVVIKMNDILTRSTLFLKHFILSDPKNVIKMINNNFLDFIMSTVCEIRSKTGRPPSKKSKGIRDILQDYYDNTFKKLIPQQCSQLDYKHLNIVFDYAATSWITDIENNIILRYVSYVESYVNHCFDKSRILEEFKNDKTITSDERNKRKREFLTRLRTIKNDILNVEKNRQMKTTNESDLKWIQEHRLLVLPDKKSFKENSILYDLKANPLSYLYSMFYIVQKLEELNGKLKNFIPLRRSIIPKNIRIDSITLKRLMEYKSTQDISEIKEDVWNEFFKTTKKCFKMKGYCFDHCIETDGISVSLLFIREDLYSKSRIDRDISIKNENNMKKKKKELYIDELSDKQRNLLVGRTVVGTDPNMGDLMYCINSSDNGLKKEQFRYTNVQRRAEIKTKKYQHITTIKKQLEQINVGEGGTVSQLETELSYYDSKTTDLEQFSNYVTAKLTLYHQVEQFYCQEIFRKFTLQRYRNTKNSEYKLIKNMKEKYGSSAVIGFGDWEQKKHRKYKEPTKGKGLRKLLRQFGFEVYLVDEFRTSKHCFNCKSEDGILEKFMKRLHPNLKKRENDETEYYVHGLLKCKTCNRLWNRDANSALNIELITREAIEGNSRPQYLARKY